LDAAEALVESASGRVEVVAPGADLDYLGAVLSHRIEGVLAECGADVVPAVVSRDSQDGDAAVPPYGVDAPGNVTGDDPIDLGDRDVLVLVSPTWGRKDCS
jgi:hypothetical protein